MLCIISDSKTKSLTSIKKSLDTISHEDRQLIASINKQPFFDYENYNDGIIPGYGIYAPILADLDKELLKLFGGNEVCDLQTEAKNKFDKFSK